MIKVSFGKQSDFPVNAKKVKDSLRKLLREKGLVSEAEASVFLVGEKKMLELSKKYLKDSRVHNVLSFAFNEATEPFTDPDRTIRLGEIVVCFPQALKEAREEEKLIDEKVSELVGHGALHLLGVHHD